LLNQINFNGYDFLAFSDQDDIWKIDKLFRACSILSDNNYDGYSSDVIAFWINNSKYKYIKKSYPKVKFDYFFESAGPGCTYVLNKNLSIDLINFVKLNLNNLVCISPSQFDWFIYYYSNVCNKKWFIDNWASLYYRQHLFNAFGANIGLKAFYYRITLVLKGWLFIEANKFIEIINNENTITDSLINKYSINYVTLLLNFKQCRRRPRDQYLFLLLMIYFLLLKKLKF
jgi:rhamnosyltransferase